MAKWVLLTDNQLENDQKICQAHIGIEGMKIVDEDGYENVDSKTWRCVVCKNSVELDHSYPEADENKWWVSKYEDSMSGSWWVRPLYTACDENCTIIRAVMGWIPYEEGVKRVNDRH